MQPMSVSRVVMEQNAFLRLLPDEMLETLRPSLEIVELESDAGGFLPSRLGDGFYFSVDGVLAVVRDIHGGGFVRIEARSHLRDVVVVGSERGLRAPGAVVWSLIGRRADWGGWAFEVGRLRNAISMVNIACTASHPFRERVTRLLIEARAAFPSERVIPLTQQQLSQLVGTRRETVNLVINELQREGAIGTGRGRIEVLDGARLESAACRCCRETRALEERTRALVRDFFAMGLGSAARGGRLR